MSIEIYSGLTGSGKSLELARTGIKLMKRNHEWFKATGQVRKVASRLRFAPHIEKRYARYLSYWEDLLELPALEGVDILWDEISTDLDATNWENIPHAVKRWLQQHEKKGVEIYATAQDFLAIYNAARRLTGRLFFMRKAIGSRRPHPTKPPIKRIWGLILKREVKREDFLKEKEEARFEGIEWFFIRRKDCELYDTRQEIHLGALPPLQHRERKCDTCGQVKIQHV